MEQLTEHPPLHALSKSERRKLKKERKLEERTLQHTITRNKRIAVWLGSASVVIAIIYGIVFASRQSSATRLGEDIPEQGRQHISITEEHEEYNSNPPTSGSHLASPANWGVYQNELQDEQVIHNLEHGGIWLSYATIDDETKDNLEAIGRRYSGRMVVSPRAANDAPIAVASWGRLLKLDAYDEAQIVDFVKKNTNKSPERLAR